MWTRKTLLQWGTFCCWPLVDLLLLIRRLENNTRGRKITESMQISVTTTNYKLQHRPNCAIIFNYPCFLLRKFLVLSFHAETISKEGKCRRRKREIFTIQKNLGRQSVKQVKTSTRNNITIGHEAERKRIFVEREISRVSLKGRTVLKYGILYLYIFF